MALGVPVADLIGGRCRDEIPLYANINRATTDRTPAGFARNAAAAIADGFDAVKLAPFDGMPAGIDRASDAREGIACMEAVRAAIGPDISLLIDCHSHFTARGGCEVFDALKDLDLYWYEEPVPDEDHEGYRTIKDHIDVPLAGGESLMYREGFWPVLDQGLMDVIMPDVTIVGGLGELKKVAAMAEGRGIPTAPHGPFGPLTIAAGVQAMAAHPGFQVLEYAWGEVPWRHELIEPAGEDRRRTDPCIRPARPGRLAEHGCDGNLQGGPGPVGGPGVSLGPVRRSRSQPRHLACQSRTPGPLTSLPARP